MQSKKENLLTSNKNLIWLSVQEMFLWKANSIPMWNSLFCHINPQENCIKLAKYIIERKQASFQMSKYIQKTVEEINHYEGEQI